MLKWYRKESWDHQKMKYKHQVTTNARLYLSWWETRHEVWLEKMRNRFRVEFWRNSTIRSSSARDDFQSRQDSRVKLLVLKQAAFARRQLTCSFCWVLSNCEIAQRTKRFERDWSKTHLRSWTRNGFIVLLWVAKIFLRHQDWLSSTQIETS